MILFLSFPPLQFMGGAEKVIYKFAKAFQKKEPIMIMNVDQQIADTYGLLVLKRKFQDRRAPELKRTFLPQTLIRVSDFIPFTPGWKKVREVIKQARIIYMKFEIPELCILIYFGGFDVYKKQSPRCIPHYNMIV